MDARHHLVRPPSEAGLFSLPTTVDQPLCSLAYLLSGYRRSAVSCSQLAAESPAGHLRRAPAVYRANVRSAIKRIRNKFRDFDPTFDRIENYTAFGYCWKKPD
jgi:hypothetical protein